MYVIFSMETTNNLNFCKVTESLKFVEIENNGHSDSKSFAYVLM